MLLDGMIASTTDLEDSARDDRTTCSNRGRSSRRFGNLGHVFIEGLVAVPLCKSLHGARPEAAFSTSLHVEEVLLRQFLDRIFSLFFNSNVHALFDGLPESCLLGLGGSLLRDLCDQFFDSLFRNLVAAILD